MEMSNEQLLPTLFFLRFDRIKDTINPSFFDNLVGLRDATHQRLCYVFTSFRSLDVLSPGVFPKASLSVFSHLMYIPPASTADMQVIYAALNKRYQLRLSSVLETALFTMVAGNVQYLQLALIILNEKKKELPISKEALLELLISDERFALQSEELWESLTDEEQKVLMKVQSHEILNEQDREQGQYLWQVGFLQDEAEKTQLFSPLFAQYIHAKSQDFKNGQEEKNIHFSRKEHLLFTLLEKFLGEICERDEIISAVWPEYQELGVSDWAIDRLVARVRTKLREQESKYEIKTIRTRGYQLIISH
jgi:hypothetical protein